jgi:hypothetical protein
VARLPSSFSFAFRKAGFFLSQASGPKHTAIFWKNHFFQKRRSLGNTLSGAAFNDQKKCSLSLFLVYYFFPAG